MNSSAQSFAGPSRGVLAASILCGLLSWGSAAQAATVVTVSADTDWVSSSLGTPLDTGLSLNAGDLLSITAAGTWNGGACGDVGPDGSPCYPGLIPGIASYSLVGRIGAGDFFAVGPSYSGVALHGGTLYLGFVDVNGFDNTGTVSATVSISSVPEPRSLALLLAGVGVVGWAAQRRRAA